VSLEDIFVMVAALIIAAMAVASVVLERKPKAPTDAQEPVEGDGRWTVEMGGEKLWSGKEGVFPNTQPFSVFGYGPDNNENARRLVEEDAKHPLIDEDGKEIPIEKELPIRRE
jgi:hypothetical protein